MFINKKSLDWSNTIIIIIIIIIKIGWHSVDELHAYGPIFWNKKGHAINKELVQEVWH